MTAALRAVGYLWASPTVVAALLFFLLPMWAAGQLRPTCWRDGAWEWEVVSGSRFWGSYTSRGWWATTLGWVIFFSPGLADYAPCAVHERRHVWQSLWLGPLYLPLHGFFDFIYPGYAKNPLELDAYAVQRAFEQSNRSAA